MDKFSKFATNIAVEVDFSSKVDFSRADPNIASLVGEDICSRDGEGDEIWQNRVRQLVRKGVDGGSGDFLDSADLSFDNRDMDAWASGCDGD